MKKTRVFKLWGLAIFILSFTGCGFQQKSLEKKPPPENQKRIVPMKSTGIKNDYKEWETLGFKKGDQLPDFTIFDLEGVGLNLSEELKKGKPIMLVTGSYTCAITRGNISKINELSEFMPIK